MLLCGEFVKLKPERLIAMLTDKETYGDTETPRCTLLWPALKPDASDPINKRLKKIDKSPLINHVSLSPDMKYLVACTDNNLVCLWSKIDK